MAKLVVMVGLPGAGKTTKTEEYLAQGFKIHSSDAIRLEVFNEVYNAENTPRVFSIMRHRALDDLKRGYDVVYDATNLSRKARRYLISQLNSHTDEVIAHVILRPYEDIKEYNSKRDFNLDKLKQYMIGFQLPTLTEGFTNIKYSLTPSNYDFLGDITDFRNFIVTALAHSVRMDLHPFIKSIKAYDQNNSYHSKTLDDHILSVYENSLLFNNKEVIIAALFHDVGKPFSAVENKHGGTSYYGHENISAYLTRMLFTYFEKNINLMVYPDVDAVINLISFHMRMHQTTTTKSKNKLIGEAGKDLYPHLCELFVSDVGGK